MGNYNHEPSGDWRNDGWACNGGFNDLWQCWSSSNDSNYCSCPGYQGVATVNFPIDITGVPTGAVITSVSVNIRCSTGSGTPPANTAPSLVIALSCSDDTSTAVSRTVFPTSVIESFTVASFKNDAANLQWDIERLNKVLVAAYCPQGVYDLVRCHELYLVINYRVAPTIVVTAPTGLQNTPSPTISWTYSQADGDKLDHSVYKIFTAAQAAVASFDPNATVPVYQQTVKGNISSVQLPTSLDPNGYWVYVQSYSSFQAKSIWVGRQFQVSAPSPGIPGVPPTVTPGVQAPGYGVVQIVQDTVNGCATLTVQDTSNMMSVQDANAELVSDGSCMVGLNCTGGVRDSSTFYAPNELASWQMSSLAAGDMTLVSDYIEVDPGMPITVSAQFIAAVTGRNTLVGLTFFDANFNELAGSIFQGSAITDAPGTWLQSMATGTTPAGCALALATFTVEATGAANEVHNVDHLGVMYGTDTPWSDGGQMSRNLLSSWYSNAEGSPGSGEGWTPSVASSITQTANTGLGASGSTCQQMTYVGISPTVGFRDVGTPFTTPTFGTDYTLNKPPGAVQGDLMIASVRTFGDVGVNAPSGWNVVDSVSVTSDGATNISEFILSRSCTASEPTSWTDGTITAGSQVRSATVVAYSGAADASVQFLSGEAARSTPNNTPPYLTTPNVSSADPNAWRVSSFAFADSVSGGTLAANRQAPSIIPAITFVGSGTPWSSDSTALSYTVNRPPGIQSGDYMVATIGACGLQTFTAPSGWTIVYQEQNTSGSHFSAAVMTRFAGSSEPGSWSGTVSGSFPFTHARVTSSVAYRNVNATTPLIHSAGQQTSAGSSVNTPSVSNTNSKAWRLSVYMSQDDAPYPSGNWSAADTERVDAAENPGSDSDGATIGIFDSNGPVSTGTYSLTGIHATDFYDAQAWLGFLNPLATAPALSGYEYSRYTGGIGSGSSYLYGGFFDSGAPSSVSVPAGSVFSVTGSFTSGSGSGMMESATGWVGFVSPADATVSGYASATMASVVDISSINPTVLALAGNQMSANASFLGSSSGTPYLTVNFYRANQLISSSISAGDTAFGTSAWAKSSAVFDVPSGTTRVALGISASDRNVGDVIFFDRVSLAFGAEDVYRTGTSSSIHSIFATPQLEFTDDSGEGYGAWQLIQGSSAALPPVYDAFSGLSTYTDHTVVPLTNRKYRAQTITYGLAGDQFSSGYGPESQEFSLTALYWWLKDIANPAANLQLKIQWNDLDVSTSNTAVPFQALGQGLPIVLTEGFAGDYLSVHVRPIDHDDWVKLIQLLASGRTLFLQSDVDQSWWVQCVGDPISTMIAYDQRREAPLRDAYISFIQVAPEV